jgi:hypothetical protein
MERDEKIDDEELDSGDKEDEPMETPESMRLSQM